jgi:hypothetical protein
VSTRISTQVLVVAIGIGLGAAGVVALTAQSANRATPLPPDLAATRAALDKYRDPMQAIRDGYFSTVACIEYRPAGKSAHEHMQYKPGAMGVHFLNAANIGATLDSLKPQVLMYEPVGDKLVLVGAEWFVPVAVSKDPPRIFGQTLQGPMEGHDPIMPAGLHHWDLHVWLWRENPSGVFSPTNPRVTCPRTGYGYSFDDAPPRIVRP